MSNYDNTNKGALFKNDKGDNPSRPDCQGKININGIDHKLSGWWQTPKNGGEKFLALKASEFIPKSAFAPKNPTEFLQPAEGEDDIPF
jgi:hypothetical protein